MTNEIEAQTAMEPVEPMAPVEAAAQAVMTAISQALPALEAETEALRNAPRLDVLTPLVQRKDDTLADYERCVATLRSMPDARQNLPEALRLEMLEAAKRFEEATRRNAKALDIALITSRKVMDSIMGAARAVKGGVETYGRKGAYATGGGVAPVAIDRAL